MSTDFFDKSVVDAGLADLAIAYEQVAEIAKKSHGNSDARKLAITATLLIENGFKKLAHYGNHATAEAMQKKIDAARIIPQISN